GLLAYRQVLLMDVFIARAIGHFVIYSVVFTVVLSALGLLGFHDFPLRPIELAGVITMTVLLAFVLGLLFAAVAIPVPDARAAIKILFMPLYFASGILFPVTRFPDHWVQILAINPVLHLVELCRVAAVEGYRPMPYTSIEYPLALGLLTTLIGLMLYRRRFLTKVTT